MARLGDGVMARGRSFQTRVAPGRRSSSDVSVERQGPWSTLSAAVVWNLCPPHADAGWRGMVEPVAAESEHTQLKVDLL